MSSSPVLIAEPSIVDAAPVTSVTAVPLDVRMKKYEAVFADTRVFPYQSFIIRLDGRSFSKFTRDMQQPFDSLFSRAMCMTMADLIVEFNPATIYTHSDEITMIFPKKCTLAEYQRQPIATYYHIFGGKLQKLVSTTASFCSVRFNFHLNALIKTDVNEFSFAYVQLVKDSRQTFDARILAFDEKNEYEILNHQLWRSVRDSPRNAIESYARQYYTAKELHRKSCANIIEMLAEKGLNWDNDVPTYLKYGIHCKKEYVTRHNDDGTTYTRYTLAFKTFKLKFSSENLAMLFAPAFTEEDATRLELFQNVDLLRSQSSFSPEKFMLDLARDRADGIYCSLFCAMALTGVAFACKYIMFGAEPK